MRVSNDKKDNSIRVRVSDKEMEYVAKMSKKNNISVSQYIRNMIEKEIVEDGRSSTRNKSERSIWGKI